MGVEIDGERESTVGEELTVGEGGIIAGWWDRNPLHSPDYSIVLTLQQDIL